MAKHYLNHNKLYVQSADKNLVYEVSSYDTFENADYHQINLELVAGWDYIFPDHNDVQGWCMAENFVEDVQYEIITQYFMVEGMKESLEENGYTVLGKLPEIKDKYLQKFLEDLEIKETEKHLQYDIDTIKKLLGK